MCLNTVLIQPFAILLAIPFKIASKNESSSIRTYHTQTFYNNLLITFIAKNSVKKYLRGIYPSPRTNKDSILCSSVWYPETYFGTSILVQKPLLLITR